MYVGITVDWNNIAYSSETIGPIPTIISILKPIIEIN